MRAEEEEEKVPLEPESESEEEERDETTHNIFNPEVTCLPSLSPLTLSLSLSGRTQG